MNNTMTYSRFTQNRINLYDAAKKTKNSNQTILGSGAPSTQKIFEPKCANSIVARASGYPVVANERTSTS